MPPRSAIVNAGRIRFFIVAKSRRGITGNGNEDGIASNLLPIDSTGK